MMILFWRASDRWMGVIHLEKLMGDGGCSGIVYSVQNEKKYRFLKTKKGRSYENIISYYGGWFRIALMVELNRLQR